MQTIIGIVFPQPKSKNKNDFVVVVSVSRTSITSIRSLTTIILSMSPEAFNSKA